MLQFPTNIRMFDKSDEADESDGNVVPDYPAVVAMKRPLHYRQLAIATSCRLLSMWAIEGDAAMDEILKT